MPEVRFVPAIGRSIETQKAYVDHLAEKRCTGDHSCDLCGSVERQNQTNIYPTIKKLGDRAMILSNDIFTLIDNDFPYNSYDGQEIVAHHMLVPRQHIDFNALVSDRELRHAFSDAEAEVLDLSDGAYGTIMARTSDSVASSIRSHAHKHFFVTGAPIIEQTFSVPARVNDVRFSSHGIPIS